MRVNPIVRIPHRWEVPYLLAVILLLPVAVLVLLARLRRS